MISFALFIAFSICLWILLTKRSKAEVNKLPPGPKGIPLFGNLLQIGRRMERVLTQWAKEYGNIYYIQLGQERVVVISDHKIMKEMLNEPAFSGRPDSVVFQGTSEGAYGVVNSEKEDWEIQRRFTLRHLRDFGFCKNYMENLIVDEVNEVLDWFKEKEGESISLHGRFSLAVLNSLWSITGGRRFTHEDQNLVDLLSSMMKAFSALLENGFLLFAPWVRFIAPELSGWNRLQRALQHMNKFFKDSVEEHKSTFNENHIRDFIDHYIQEINSTTDPKSTFYGDVGYKHLSAIVGDLFVARSETTSTTLTWAMLYLSSHPMVQAKLQEEIDEVVGKSRLPTLQDRAKMPFAEAILYEVLRYSILLPTGVFHKALETREFQGYVIPKGTWIIANIHAVHNNKEIWGDPEHFRPERFLSNDGKSVKKPDALIPFQVGKRQCLGEPLAKDTLFLFIVSIFQRFEVYHDGETKPDFEPEVGFLNAPKPFSVLMKERAH